MRILSSVANIHASASTDSETTSQALLGESVDVLSEQDEWSEIRLLSDGYQGFIENRHLSSVQSPVTHRVVARATPLFSNPDIKSPIMQHAPVGALLTLRECEHPTFYQSNTGHYVWAQHTIAINQFANGQLVDTAHKLFLGAPYIWGGRSGQGLDCSAVV